MEGKDNVTNYRNHTHVIVHHKRYFKVLGLVV